MQLERAKGKTARINGLLVSSLGHTLLLFNVFFRLQKTGETSYDFMAMAGSDPDPMSTAWR